MPTLFRKFLGSVGADNTATTTALTTEAAVAVGEAVLVAVTFANPWTNNWDLSGSVTVTDAGNNHYQLVAEHRPTLGNVTNGLTAIPPRLLLFACLPASGSVSAGQDITVTHPRGPAHPTQTWYKTARVVQAIAVSGINHFDVEATKQNRSWSTDSGYTTQTAKNEGFIFGAIGWCDSLTSSEYTTPSVGGTWSNSTKKRSDITLSANWPARYNAAQKLFWKVINRRDQYHLRGEFDQNGYQPYWANAIAVFNAIGAGAEPDAEWTLAESGAGEDGVAAVQTNVTHTVTESASGWETLTHTGPVDRDWTVQEYCTLVDSPYLGGTSFQNQFRFRPTASASGVNVAWLRLPELTPGENLSLIEVGKFVAENIPYLWQEQPRAYEALDQGFRYRLSYNPQGATASAPLSGAPEYQVDLIQPSPSGLVLQNFTSEIGVLAPPENTQGPWYLRFQDGVITRRHVIQSGETSWLTRHFSVGDTVMLYYSIPEAGSLPTYYTGASGEHYQDSRTVDVSGALVDVIDVNTLQFPKEFLQEIWSLKINGAEQITAASGRVLMSDPDPDQWQVPPRGVINAWDPESGRVTLSRSLATEDVVTACFRYQERFWTYGGYRDDSGIWHDLNLNPAPGFTFDGGRSTAELLNRPVYVYLLPTAAYRLQRADGTIERSRTTYSGLRWTESFLRWDLLGREEADETADPFDPCQRRSTFGYTHFGSMSFISKISRDPQLTNPTSGVTVSGLAAYPSALLLAKVYATPNSQLANVERVDTRVRGGGVPEELNIQDPYLPGATRRELEHYWDLGGWDGAPVPLMGSILVEIPRGFLDGTNGYPQFSDEEIRSIVQSRAPAGTKVLIRYL